MTSLAVPSSCVATQTPMGTNSGTRRRKRKFLLLFVNCDRGRIEIDHLYGLCCRGWYCNPEQHWLCRPARPQAAGTTRAVPDCSTNHSSTDRIVVNSYNPEQHELCRPSRGRAGRHNECCSGLQYQPRQRRLYQWSISILPRSQFYKKQWKLAFSTSCTAVRPHRRLRNDA